MSKMTKISLILPLYNSEKYLDELFESIRNQTFKDFELIIIDDFSTDNTKEILKKMNLKFYENQENLGFAKIVNKGIKLAKGEFICILDHDVVYDKNYLNDLLKENKDIVASKVYYYKQKNKIRALEIKVNLLTGKTKILGRDKIDKGQFNSLKEIKAMGIAGSMIKRKVFENVGLIDEAFFFLYADTDFCYRAREKGYEIFSSDAKCWHKKEEKEVFPKDKLDNYYHDKKLFLKRHSPFYPICLVPINIKKMIS